MDEYFKQSGNQSAADAVSVCANCGSEIPAGEEICPKCGKNLKNRRSLIVTGIIIAVIIVIGLIFAFSGIGLTGGETASDLSEAYDIYCSPSWADISGDGAILIIDNTAGSEKNALKAISKINEDLGIPSYVTDRIKKASASEGLQMETHNGILVTWMYTAPDGISVMYMDTSKSDK